MRRPSTNKREEQFSKRKWRQWKPAEARLVVDEWGRSGLSAAAFARKAGVSEPRLWYWSKRLGEGAVERKPRAVEFVAVPLPASGPSSRRGLLEIEHAGVFVRVREDLDVEHVARLVFALARGRASC
jgi:transposase-like protein